MTSPARFLTAACLAFGSIALAAPCSAGSDDPVNVAAAAVRNTSGTLRIGVDVKAGQTVRTGADERVDLLFTDGSSFTLGPSSRTVIVAFAHDPRQGSGHLVLRADAGLFRFTGGKIAKAGQATIQTPAASLAVRDGIVLVKVDASSTTAILTAGAGVTIVTKEGTETLSRPGWQVTAEPGRPPSAAAAAPPTLVSAELAALEAGPNRPGHGAGGGRATESSKAALNALSDADTSLQKAPSGAPLQSLRTRVP